VPSMKWMEMKEKVSDEPKKNHGSTQGRKEVLVLDGVRRMEAPPVLCWVKQEKGVLEVLRC
jgi:hypothetical protein